ncbi:MAG: hypothetical protein QNK37_30675 [Acidobacteriota bacterium]|nr:hypothetical protein [Acidobacteriota bacterium]
MKKIDDAVRELRKVLVDEEDFSEIMCFYFDHLNQNRAFHKMSRPKQSKELMDIIKHAAGKLFRGKRVIMAATKFYFIKKYNLYHGLCHIHDMSGIVFYFKDMGKGMLTLGDHKTKYTQFCRLTTLNPPPDIEGPYVVHNPAEPATD